MNPPPLMKLVEIVRGIATEDEVFDTIKALAERYFLLDFFQAPASQFGVGREGGF